LYHTLGKLQPRKPASRVYLHFLEKMPGQELPNVGDLLFGMVNAKRIEIEEDPMGKVEIGGAALDDKAN
jgi:hypothetical protein